MGKKPGGQERHPGTTLVPKENPDSIVKHEAQQCSCGCDLNEVSGAILQERQVADLLEVRIEYTGHQITEKNTALSPQKFSCSSRNDIEDTVT